MSAADEIQEDSSGFLRESSDGFLLEDTTCCCTSGPCANCAGTPAGRTLTATGIDYTTGNNICIDISALSFPGGYNSMKVGQSVAIKNPNVTISVTYAGTSSCKWFNGYYGSPFPDGAIWTSTTCTGSVIGSSLQTSGIWILLKQSTKWILACKGPSLLFAGKFIDTFLFYAETSEGTGADCNESLSFTNSLTTLGPITVDPTLTIDGYAICVGTGGSASV